MASRAPVLALTLLALPACQARTLPPSPPPLPPEVQDVSVEHGDRAKAGEMTLCDSPSAFIPFDRPVERQVYEVLSTYPTGMDETLERLTAKVIVQESDRYHLDPWLVMGVIRVESRFYDFSQSNQGAMGLMQLLPDVGEELAHDMGVPWTGPGSLYNPVKNVKLGVAYLAILNRSFHGNLDHTLAAYNMGPGRVHEWLSAGRDIPRSYASLVEEYKKGYRQVAHADNLRLAVYETERAVAKAHQIVIVPVAEVDPSEGGVAVEAAVPGLLHQPEIEAVNDLPPEVGSLAPLPEPVSSVAPRAEATPSATPVPEPVAAPSAPAPAP